jgi:hypothetical protein
LVEIGRVADRAELYPRPFFSVVSIRAAVEGSADDASVATFSRVRFRAGFLARPTKALQFLLSHLVGFDGQYAVLVDKAMEVIRASTLAHLHAQPHP